MQLTALVAAAGLAVSTTAFLLPPDASDSDRITTLPVSGDDDFGFPQASESHKLKLDCPGCPVRLGHHGQGNNKAVEIKTDIPSHVKLDFNIDHGVDHDRLMVNGFELYPHSDPFRHTLMAHVAPKHHKGRKHDKPDHKKADHKDAEGHHKGDHKGKHKWNMQPLGFGFAASTLAKSAEDNMELVQIDFQIIEVGDVFVEGVPTVEIKLVKTPEGGLMIGNMHVTPSETLQTTPMEKLEECTTLVCKWKAILSQQLGRLRPNQACAGHAGKTESHSAHDGHRGHHGHHGGSGRVMQHRHQWTHLLKSIASHILLPIAVGIVAGITASILGMVVGTAIVFLWRTFFRPASARRHRRSQSTHKAARVEAAASDEKVGLMAYQDEDDVESPPAYVEESAIESKKSAENDA